MKKITLDINKINFQKMNDLVPAVIQDVNSLQVLMVGFMNKEALEKTIKTGKVTFWSRTKKRLWMKGEISRDFLYVKDIKIDCDNDSLLILVDPVGNTCHLGKKSCFKTKPDSLYFLKKLEQLIQNTQKIPRKNSYTSELFSSGIRKIAQKVGEESTEMIIAALSETKERFVSESADFFFHWLVLCTEKNVDFIKIVEELKKRKK